MLFDIDVTGRDRDWDRERREGLDAARGILFGLAFSIPILCLIVYAVTR
jgi:hypothetical protein